MFNEAWLRDALRTGRFDLHYQAQYGSRDMKLVGVEGLARLRALDGGIVPPSRFITVLEGTDLIHEVGASLFERGCTDSLRWPGITVAINVSPVQFRDPALAARLIGIAGRVGADPRAIEIEITEGMFFDDPSGAERALHALVEAGFQIALDDFGTGYSSLAYLLNFPVGKFKIDRSFIVDIPDRVRSTTIVHALVALGRALGLKIVAEGVETEEQRVFLRTAGCHILQGFLFAEALERDRMDDLFRQSLWPARAG